MCRFEKVAAVVPGLNMADKYQRIAEYYSRLVSTIQRHYLLHKDNPPVAWNEPPLAGTGTDTENIGPDQRADRHRAAVLGLSVGWAAFSIDQTVPMDSTVIATPALTIRGRGRLHRL